VPPDPDEDPEGEGPTCDYCGYAGLALCSPLVKGQTRAEALAHIEMFQKMEAWYTPSQDGEQRLVQVFLKEDGKRKPAVLPMPFWPSYDSEFCEDLPGPVVHEYCACLMAEARAASQEHTLRKLKQEAVAQAIRLSGIRTHPLGRDRHNWEYWQLPWDNQRLYVTQLPNSNVESTSLLDLFDQEPKWICYESCEDFQALMNYLNPSGLREGPLLLNLQTHFKDILKRARRRQLENNTVGSSESAQQTDHSNLDDGMSMSDGLSESGTNMRTQRTRKHEDEDELDESVYSGQHKRDLETEDNESFEVDIESEQTGEKIVLLQDVPESVIPSGEVTAQFQDDNDETTEDGLFSFNSKGGPYYAAAIVDKEENVVHVRKAQLVFEIYQGVELVNTEICTKAWTDGVYYFNEVNFRRSGLFKLKFSLRPGTPPGQSLTIKPDVYEVKVTPSYAKTGAAAAVNRLCACDFLNSRNRALQITQQVDLELETDVDEVSALRMGLLAVACALPKGALVVDEGYSPSFDPSLSLEPPQLRLPNPGEPWAWNQGMEHAWFEKLSLAQTCEQVLELILILESCLAPEWLEEWYRPLMNKSLPAEHCLRVGTPAITALRLFLLDKALDYKKVSMVSRAKQLALNREQEMMEKIMPQGGRVTRGAIAAAVAKVESKSPRAKGRSTRTSQAAAGTGSPMTGRRPPSRSRRQPPLEQLSTEFSDSDEASETGSDYLTSPTTRRRSRRTGSSREWECTQCRTLNESYTRRCEECNSFRPASAANRMAAPQARSRRTSRTTRAAKRKRPWEDSESEEDVDNFDESDGAESSSSFSASSNVRGSRRRLPPRRTRQGSNFDDSFSSQQSSTRRRGGRRRSKRDSDDETGSEKQFSYSLPEFEFREFVVRCLAIIRDVCDSEMADPFLEEVDTSIYTDYRKFVKKPMDFHTITGRLKSGHYQSDLSTFMDDIRQIWKNCELYNGKRADITKSALQLKAIAERGWTNYILDDERPPFEDLADDKCSVCREVGDASTAQCAHCLSLYHLECLGEDDSDAGSTWHCPDCEHTLEDSQGRAPRNHQDGQDTPQMSEQLSIASSPDEMPSTQRSFSGTDGQSAPESIPSVSSDGDDSEYEYS